MNLGRLEPVSLRDIWKSESADFTPWLARPENIRLLGEAIGLELEVEAQEKDVGPFRADILCKETANDAWVLIENQIERTDHTHLGQLITYAAGLEAVVVVWIAEQFTEEHRAALDWLNEIANEKLRCFGLEIELWRIGDSPVAPKFNVVSKPNDWSRSVSNGAGYVASELTDTKRLQLEFWTAFASYLRDSKSTVKPQKPLPQHWMNLALGKSGVHLTAIAAVWGSDADAPGEGELRAEVVLDHRSQAKSLFVVLEGQRPEIEKEYGGELKWQNPEVANACHISERRSADMIDRARWPEYHDWLRDRLERMHRVFSPRVKSLKVVNTVEG